MEYVLDPGQLGNVLLGCLFKIVLDGAGRSRELNRKRDLESNKEMERNCFCSNSGRTITQSLKNSKLQKRTFPEVSSMAISLMNPQETISIPKSGSIIRSSCFRTCPSLDAVAGDADARTDNFRARAVTLARGWGRNMARLCGMEKQTEGMCNFSVPWDFRSHLFRQIKL